MSQNLISNIEIRLMINSRNQGGILVTTGYHNGGVELTRAVSLSSHATPAPARLTPAAASQMWLSKFKLKLVTAKEAVPPSWRHISRAHQLQGACCSCLGWADPEPPHHPGKFSGTALVWAVSSLVSDEVACGGHPVHSEA